MSIDIRENRFHAWETDYNRINNHTHGYYYRAPVQLNTYNNDNRKNYNMSEWKQNATICNTMMKMNRNSVVRDTGVAGYEVKRPLSLARTNSSDNFIDFVKWKVTDDLEGRLKEAYDVFVNQNGNVYVKDMKKLIKFCLGDDTPTFILDKYAILAWKSSTDNVLKWDDFRSFINTAASAIEADCTSKSEVPPLVKLMNKPRMHDKELGQYNISSSIYMDTYNFNAAEAQKQMQHTMANRTLSTKFGDDEEEGHHHSTSKGITCEVKATRKMVLNPATEVLAKGTSKVTEQLPGYSGHISYNMSNERKLVHASGKFVHPTDNNLLLTQRGMGCILGYGGYVPKPSLHVKFNERKTGCDPLTTTGSGYGSIRKML